MVGFQKRHGACKSCYLLITAAVSLKDESHKLDGNRADDSTTWLMVCRLSLTTTWRSYSGQSPVSTPSSRALTETSGATSRWPTSSSALWREKWDPPQCLTRWASESVAGFSQFCGSSKPKLRKISLPGSGSRNGQLHDQMCLLRSISRMCLASCMLVGCVLET